MQLEIEWTRQCRTEESCYRFSQILNLASSRAVVSAMGDGSLRRRDLQDCFVVASCPFPKLPTRHVVHKRVHLAPALD